MKNSLRWLVQLIPIIHWLPRYQAAWLWPDLIAGVTLAAYAVPVAMAYATLAGLAPQAGLYCYIFSGVAYALFASSRHLSVGPTAAISPSSLQSRMSLNSFCFLYLIINNSYKPTAYIKIKY